MNIPYFYMMLFVEMISEENDFVTIDELLDFLEENEDAVFQVGNM